MATMATYKVPKVENENNVSPETMPIERVRAIDVTTETLRERLARPESSGRSTSRSQTANTRGAHGH